MPKTPCRPPARHGPRERVMKLKQMLALVATALLATACGGGSAGSSGGFRLIEFLEATRKLL